MAASAPRAALLALLCADPPPAERDGRPCEFGLQDARQVLHPGDAEPGGVRFTLAVAVRAHRHTGAPDFAGPFVHGPLGGRFLYLGWRALGDPAYIRRYKIPLAGIAWELLDAAGESGLAATVSAATRAATLPVSWAAADGPAPSPAPAAP